LVTDGAELVAARRLLLRQAATLGHATTTDAALRLVVDGSAVLPETAGRTHRFRLPATARSIRLASRRTVPAHMRPDGDDHRCLGVAVSRITLDGREMPLDDIRLGSGWHATEADWRWTDGDAGLAVAGVRMLEIEVALTARYWLADQAAPVSAIGAGDVSAGGRIAGS
jgi:hypothetical protein